LPANRRALCAAWSLSLQYPLLAAGDEQSQPAPDHQARRETTHHTGTKNSVRIPASSGSVCSSHLTTPIGANNPIAPQARLVVSTISFWEVTTCILKSLGANGLAAKTTRTDRMSKMVGAQGIEP
jgi:hypothetical protein